MLRTHLSFYCCVIIPSMDPSSSIKQIYLRCPSCSKILSLLWLLLLDSHARSSKYFMTALGGFSTQGQNPQIPISNYTHAHTNNTQIPISNYIHTHANNTQIPISNYTHTHTPTHKYLFPIIHTHTHQQHINTYFQLHTHTHTNTQIHISNYTCAHTHTHWLLQLKSGWEKT